MKPLDLRWQRLIAMCGALAIALGISGQALAEDEMEEVVVTGSYIKRSTQDSPSPLSVISSADIENVHAVDVQELIQRLPYESGGWIRASTFDGGGGQGRIPINLRNLGDCSTLPLVNGRRHVTGWLNPSGCAAVDTNSMLPTLMVGRVEIVKDGSSALYGSDAIAGVVNFITKDNFEGVDLDMRYLVDEATQLGDEYSLGFLIGTQSDRGGFVAGGDYLERNEIPTMHPDVFRIQGGFGYSDTGQPGWYQPTEPLVWAASGNPITGNILPRNAAAVGTDPTTNPGGWGNADLNCLNVASWDGPGAALGLFPAGGTENMRCSIDYGPFFSIQEGELLHKFYAKAHYNLTDDLEVFVEGGFSEQEFYRRNSLAPQTRAPTIPTHNPSLIADANNRGIVPVPLVNRTRLLGGTPRTPEHLRPIHTEQDGDRDTIRLVAGFTWDTEIGDRAWTLNGSFTSSQNSSFQFNVEDSRAAETVFALEGLGGPNCDYAGKDQAWRDANRGSGNQNYRGVAGGANTFADGDCYYLNPMGSGLFDANSTFRDTWANPHVISCPDASQPLCSRPDPNTGNLPTGISLANPPELFNWLDGTWTQNDEYQQDVLDLVFAGDLFEMPAGTASLAVGYQRRHDSMNRQYDINFTQFNAAFRFGASNVRGELTTNAQFIELALPILETVDVQLAVRREDFKQLNQNTTDPKVSIIWRPNDSFSGRFSWGQSFRVGSILQLVGPQTIVSNTDDPLADTSFFIPWISEGQPNLAPEVSEAFNIGFSWAPTDGRFEGVTVNADYWSYTYEDLITKQSAPAILFEDGCARANARAAGGGLAAPARCGSTSNWFSGSGTPQIQPQVIRNANEAPVRVLPDFINANEAEATGLDFDIGYQWNTDSMGMFKFQVIAAWYLDYTVKAGGVTYDGVGSMNNITPIARPLPEWKVNYNINWTMDRHSIFWQTRVVSDVEWDSGWSTARRLRVLTATGRDIGTYAPGENELGGSTYSDLYYTYQLPFFDTESSVTLGLRNVFDEGVDIANNANGYSAIMQDARGRMWMLRYRMGF